MALFNNLGRKIEGIAQNAAKKSGEMVELKKINTNINAEEESIKQLYGEIGKYCFEKFGNGTENDAAILELCQKIKIHQENIRFYKERINTIKNIVVCPACENKIEIGSAFCNKCGAKIKAKIIDAKAEDNSWEHNNDQMVEKQQTHE